MNVNNDTFINDATSTDVKSDAQSLMYFEQSLLCQADRLVGLLQDLPPVGEVSLHGSIVPAVDRWRQALYAEQPLLRHLLDEAQLKASDDRLENLAATIYRALQLEFTKHPKDTNDQNWYESFLFLLDGLPPVYQLWAFCGFCQRPQTMTEHIIARLFLCRILTMNTMRQGEGMPQMAFLELLALDYADF